MRPYPTTKVFQILPPIFISLSLAACGGGGGGSNNTTSTTAEGAYEGTTSDPIDNAFELLILENGEYWTLYGTSTGNVLSVNGFVQGTGQSNNGTFTSSNAVRYDYDGVNIIVTPNGSVSANYVANSSINGSINFNNQVSFSGATIPNSTYNYNTSANLSDITGNWNLTNLSGDPIALTVNSNGSFIAIEGGCQITGTISPRSSGKNVFNVNGSLGSAPCGVPNLTLSGIAVSNIISGSRQLITTLTSSDKTAGDAFYGIR